MDGDTGVPLEPTDPGTGLAGRRPVPGPQTPLDGWEEHEARARAVILADMTYHWDGMYHFACDGGEWTATRADNGNVIRAADTLKLKWAVREDYAEQAVAMPSAALDWAT